MSDVELQASPTPAAPAAPVQTEAQPPRTLMDGAGADASTTTPAVPQSWPDNWRQLAAGEDPDFAKSLERMASPADLAKSWREAQKKIASGAHKQGTPAPGKDATPEQVAEWRKANGIPETPDGYKVELPGGLVLGEADKPFVKGFTEFVHGKGWNQEQVNTALQWWTENRVQAEQQVWARDNEQRIAAEVALRQEMGPELAAFQNAAANLLEGAPASIKGLTSARLPDGTLLGNHPDFVKWLGGLAREMNPAATVVPAGTRNAPKAIADELDSIRQVIKTDNSKYWADKNMQARFQELLAAEEAMKSRAA